MRLESRAKKIAPTNRNRSQIGVAGQVVNVETDSDKAHILQGIQQFMTSQPSNNYPSSTATTAQNASYFLHLIGICTDPRDATYSLLDDQSKKESCHKVTIDNPNIFDEEAARNQKKDYPTGEDKFPSQKDPFYEQDEAAPRTAYLQQERATTREAAAEKTILFASDLAADGGGKSNTETTPQRDARGEGSFGAEDYVSTKGKSDPNVAPGSDGSGNALGLQR